MRITDNSEFVERCGLQNDNEPTYYVLHDLNANVRLVITPILPFTLKNDDGEEEEIKRIVVEYTSHREKCAPRYGTSTSRDNNLDIIDKVLSERNFSSLVLREVANLCDHLKEFWASSGYTDLYYNVPRLIIDMKRTVLCV